MNNLVPSTGMARLRQGLNLGSHIVQGGATTPRVSLNMNRFTLVDESGTETPLPTPYMDLIFVGINPAGKVSQYYDQPYKTGVDASPKCWTWDGVNPHPRVEAPEHPVCATCPQHAWGSSVNATTGAQGRACAEFYCFAVTIPGDPEARVYRLNIKGGSFKALQAYQSSLGGYDISGVVTRLSFVSQGVLGFRPMAQLTAELEAQVAYILDDERINYVRYIVGEVDAPDGTKAAVSVLPPAQKAPAQVAWTPPTQQAAPAQAQWMPPAAPTLSQRATPTAPQGWTPPTQQAEPAAKKRQGRPKATQAVDDAPTWTPPQTAHAPTMQAAHEPADEVPAFLRRPAPASAEHEPVNGFGMASHESSPELDAKLAALNIPGI